MLKFSGFANLTSCFESLAEPKLSTAKPRTQRAQSAVHTEVLRKLAVATEPCKFDASRV